ncbi:putative methyltransferase-domain-containing protein [Amylocystis lapponica]|nr:putative methyltransferase-domain-containing protein [Amylocystis lapponica]
MDRNHSHHTAPTSSLPVLARLTDSPIHDTSVPDSGYASAEEDDDDTAELNDAYDPDILRSDPFEREYTIRWLTAFMARSDAWVSCASSDESDARAALVDTAASLLASFAGDGQEQALSRRFAFASPHGETVAELNDAPLDSADHTSVGLQSWASSIVLAEHLCAQPTTFGLADTARVLELGAGTGLLSIVAAKLLPGAQVVATDFHPSVLANLRANVAANFAHAHPVVPVVRALDWERPVYAAELAGAFDVVLAADVVYHAQHTRWIKACVERLLARPAGVMWLIIPLRSTGRHEGMGDTVEAVFPPASGRLATAVRNVGHMAELAILDVQTLERHEGVGRADEAGYRLYQIGWVPCIR